MRPHDTPANRNRQKVLLRFLPFKMSSASKMAAFFLSRPQPHPLLAAGAGVPAPPVAEQEPYASYSEEDRERIQRCPRHRITKGSHGGVLGYSPNTFGDYPWSVPMCCMDCPLAEPITFTPRLGAGAGEPWPEADNEPSYELICQPAFANGPPPGWYNPACICSRCRAAKAAEAK